jgi:hypothetical protein
MHEVSRYASVAAGRWNGNDDEGKAPLTTLLRLLPDAPGVKNTSNNSLLGVPLKIELGLVTLVHCSMIYSRYRTVLSRRQHGEIESLRTVKDLTNYPPSLRSETK